jgi:citrate synthase
MSDSLHSKLNCSTAAMRQLASTGTDPYTAVTASMVALYGPSHGGAKYILTFLYR